MSKKKERSRQELNAAEHDRIDRDDLEREPLAGTFDNMDEEDEMEEHNPNVEKSHGMKQRERDNIE
jgi:hypothetical protein